MPKETNQDQNQTPQENNPPLSEHDTTSTGAALPKGAPGVVTGALQKAVMRTFRGDAAKANGTNPAPKPPVQPKQTVSAKNSDAKNNDAIVHTFKDDVQHLVRNKKMSMTRIAAMEQNRRGPNDPVPPTGGPTRKTLFIIGAGALLFILALLFVVVAYTTQLNTGRTPTIQFAPALIYTETQEQLDITDKDAQGILDTLTNARRNLVFSVGSIINFRLIKHIAITEEQVVPVEVDAQTLIESLNARVPQNFVPTLDSDYVIGVHVLNDMVPFLILTSQSYSHTFAGMLAWEQYIEDNLAPFFSPYAQYTKPAVAEGGNEFTDTLIENMDVRILRDETGEIRMLYTFLDRQTVIITTNIQTLVELAERLRVADI